MPILDEQKLELINEIVCCAMAENKQVSISYQNRTKYIPKWAIFITTIWSVMN